MAAITAPTKPNPTTTTPVSAAGTAPGSPDSEVAASTQYKGFTVYSDSIKKSDAQVDTDSVKEEWPESKRKTSVKKHFKAQITAAPVTPAEHHEDEQVNFPEYLHEPIWLVDQQKKS